MKLTQKDLLELMSELGIKDVVLVDDDTQSEYNKDTILQTVDEIRTPIIKQLVLQQSKGEIHKEVAGTVNNSIRKQLSELTGISASEFKDMNSQQMFKHAIEHVGSTLGGDKEAFTKQMNDIIEAHNKERKRIQEEKDSEINSLREQMTDKEITAAIVNYHKEFKGLPLNVNVEKMAAQFKNHLKEKATVKYNAESNDIQLFQKTNPDLQLFNKTNTDAAKVTDLMTEYYSELGLLQKDTRNVNAVNQMQQQQETTKVNPAKNPTQTSSKQLDSVLNGFGITIEP